jgi:hypothetical protein
VKISPKDWPTSEIIEREYIETQSSTPKYSSTKYRETIIEQPKSAETPGCLPLPNSKSRNAPKQDSASASKNVNDFICTCEETTELCAVGNVIFKPAYSPISDDYYSASKETIHRISISKKCKDGVGTPVKKKETGCYPRSLNLYSVINVPYVDSDSCDSLADDYRYEELVPKKITGAPLYCCHSDQQSTPLRRPRSLLEDKDQDYQTRVRLTNGKHQQHKWKNTEIDRFTHPTLSLKQANGPVKDPSVSNRTKQSVLGWKHNEIAIPFIDENSEQLDVDDKEQFNSAFMLTSSFLCPAVNKWVMKH